jgi:hypothetical protein
VPEEILLFTMTMGSLNVAWNIILTLYVNDKANIMNVSADMDMNV